MHHIVTQGGPERRNKLLVHCHAGQGRTAIIIGAYLLYSGIASSSIDTIWKCRSGRPKLFSHKYNCKFIHQFDDFLKELKKLYPLREASLLSIVDKQQLLLQGSDADKHKFISKVINELLQRLKLLLGVVKSENVMTHSIL